MTHQKIADKYQKKSQLEHILDIPDTYIGSIEKQEESLYIFNETKNKITKKKITYIAGLQRIFEEILLNSFDQTVRNGTNTTQIKVKIDKEKNEITIWNNGKGIPVIYKESEKVYIPEMIFGMLLTSGNYDKNEKRITGGKNGYGAKLTNIFSEEFKLETVDDERKKKFQMTWKNNMGKKSKEKITDSDKAGYTKIVFKPDLKRFNISELSDDIISLMKKRVYDIAINTSAKVSVSYNGKKIAIKKFEDYIKLYLKDGEDKKILVDEDTNERWSIGLYMNDDNFEQISFVNGINTNLGGTHVDYITNKIIKEYMAKLKKKKVDVKKSYIKDKMHIFIKCFVENPSFNSQTKESMKTRSSKFGSSYDLSKKFVNGLNKIGIIEEVLSFARFKEEKNLEKTDGKIKRRITGIPKLEDANWAGTKKGETCKLILTEGDSAKTFAMSGISKIGRDEYGIFPLKGKLLNVKDQSPEKILKNEEINSLKKILGLKQNYKYKSLNELRYGGIIILTDQDVDGSHIKGLVMNFFHTFWPELLELGFIKSLITPIVKAFKKGTKETLQFYTLTDFENWKKTVNLKKWMTKYYKGLGTSNAKEAKGCLENIEEKIVTYSWDEFANKSLNLGFKKDQADERKKWLLKFDKEDVLDQKLKDIPISDFINKELIHFSNYDIHRSIPSLVDGLKPTQRKILYTGLNHLTSKEIKVAQFSGLVGQKTDYHHGEASIVSTTIKMAQNFIGSNNCNLLLPNGQFGTRLLGGDDRSSERYIFTNISPITKKIFNINDNNLLKYLKSDNLSIEPEWYMPCIPLILLNGTMGIGTGFSTTVLQHKLEDLVKNIKDRINDEVPKKLTPWYRSFKGEIKSLENNKYQSVGIYKLNKQNNTIIITELPIGTWTEKYKIFLEKILIDKTVSNKRELKLQCIKNYNNHSTESNINFELVFSGIQYTRLTSKGKDHILKTLKLTSNLSENNMYLFNKDNTIQKYNNTDEIMEDYYKIRFKYYELRKQKMIEILENIVDELKNKVRFIRMVKSKQIDILDTTDEKLENDLIKDNFKKLLNSSNELSFNYLTTMHIRSLTLERANKLEKECDLRMKELKELKLKNIKNMWLEDLKDILIENEKYNKDLAKELLLEKNDIKKKSNIKKKRNKKR
tara:strand:+ start:2044 stop:5478 length:3435 start_codon:yes stop_codon:yes gene_type:complete